MNKEQISLIFASYPSLKVSNRSMVMIDRALIVRVASDREKRLLLMNKQMGTEMVISSDQIQQLLIHEKILKFLLGIEQLNWIRTY